VTSADRDLELPAAMRAEFARSARSWIDEPVAARPVPPRLAASVLLLREVPGAFGPRLEVFTQQRVAEMAFAASMHVYPGGGVDVRDGEGELDWAGPGRTPAWWARVLGVDVARARLVVLAAVREVFEECGVLFAGQRTRALLRGLGQQWQDQRAALVSHRLTVAEMARSESLVLRSDLLHPLARWVTPECEPRRYDTFFFAAALPPGQRADGRTSEARSTGWVDPGRLVQEASSELMAPTQLLAEQLAGATGMTSYLRGRPSLKPVLPYPVDTADGIRLRVPGGE